jgi:hypothetical protein
MHSLIDFVETLGREYFMECTIDEESNPSENPTKERKFVELVSFV